MKRILKYEIPVKDQEFTLTLHADGNILSIQTQYGIPQMWVLADETKPKEDVKFLLLTTGEEVDRYIGAYLGTFQLSEGGFVGHIFLAQR